MGQYAGGWETKRLGDITQGGVEHMKRVGSDEGEKNPVRRACVAFVLAVGIEKTVRWR